MNDLNGATAAMRTIDTITRTADGVGAAIRAQSAKSLGEALTCFLIENTAKKSPAELIDLSIATNHVFTNILTNKSGAIALSKHCGVSQYLSVLSCLMADEKNLENLETKEVTKNGQFKPNRQLL